MFLDLERKERIDHGAKKRLGLALLLLIATITMGSVMWARTDASAAAPPAGGKESKTAATPIGGQVPNSNSLRNVHGNRRSLHSFKNHKAIVLVFLGTGMPCI